MKIPSAADLLSYVLCLPPIIVSIAMPLSYGLLVKPNVVSSNLCTYMVLAYSAYSVFVGYTNKQSVKTGVVWLVLLQLVRYAGYLVRDVNLTAEAIIVDLLMLGLEWIITDECKYNQNVSLL